MRILLVDDDELVTAGLGKMLADQHYVVDVAGDSQRSWEFVEAFTYDLILLDVVLPHLDGIQFCRQLRAKGYQMPILLLTAQASPIQKVLGLDAGADDYLAKPFEIAELLARIRALLRRSSSPQLRILEWENLQIDPGICTATYRGLILHLTPKEYRLLELFLRHQHRVFSRSAILDHLWPDEEAPRKETITVHIKSLRQKLKRVGAPANLIETVYGQGYRLKQLKLAEVEPAPLPAQDIQQQTKARLAIVWEKYRGLSHDRLAVLREAALQWFDNQLTEEQQQVARQTAHKLAGALGIFGFMEGSQFAKEAEELFQAGGSLTQTQAVHLSGLLAALGEILEQSSGSNSNSTDQLPTQTPTFAPPAQSSSPSDQEAEPKNGQVPSGFMAPISPRSRVCDRPLLLVVDDDVNLAKAIVHRVRACEISAELVTSVTVAREIIQAHPHPDFLPNVVVLSVSLSHTPDEELLCLAECANQTPPLPVLLFTDRDDLSDRVKMARFAVHAFVPKLFSPEQVLDVILRVRSRTDTTRAKVMVVDDDRALLTVMQTLLNPLGLQLITLEKPLQFWQTLEAAVPDLLILDVQMPHFNGIQLCQVLRNSPLWSQLPVLFLTAYLDDSVVNAAFAAGANDCMSKAIREPELVSRIVNRIERTQLLQAIADATHSWQADAIHPDRIERCGSVISKHDF